MLAGSIHTPKQRSQGPRGEGENPANERDFAWLGATITRVACARQAARAGDFVVARRVSEGYARDHERERGFIRTRSARTIMEGYREPDAPKGEPALSRCEKHSLSFDPAVQPGCTICRREFANQAPKSSSRGILIAVLLLWLVGMAFTYWRMRTTHDVPVGGICTQREGCVEGAECLGGIGGRTGHCYRACMNDEACASGDVCSEGHCMPGASANEECGQGTVCRGALVCVTLVGRSGRCLARCTTESDCPAGMACTPVMASLAPVSPVFETTLYCLPNP